MTKSLVDEAAKALAAEGEKTRALAASLTDADAARIAFGDWTVKDVLGHVSASFQGLLRRMQGTMPSGGAPKSLDEINEERRQVRVSWPLAQVLDELETGRAALLEFFAGLDDAAAARDVRMTAYSAPLWRVAWICSSHERSHRGHVAAALGRREPGGRVAWLNLSPGGVPKLPVFSARLGEEGLEGDAHRGAGHGGVERALCLFSLELIEALQDEGHPIYPGAIGENVTVGGLDWSVVKPGDRLKIGPALVEITRYTTPCVNIKGAFKDEDFTRVLATRHPGESRAYARVIEGGELRVGDAVSHQPA